MSNKPTHNVFIAEDGEDKSYFTNIGSAWEKDTGTISVELRPGLAVSGRFVILPRREGEEAEA